MRLFAYRFFDTEILSVRGDLSSLLSQVAALLAALSLVLVLLTAPKYAGLYHHLTANQLYPAAWADQEFLISTSSAGRRVYLVPLRMRCFRTAAIA